MKELFFINIEFRGTKRKIEGCLHLWDYCHQIEVEIDNNPVIFKLGKDLRYQAVVNGVQPGKIRHNPALVRTIAKGLDQLLSADLQSEAISL